MSSTAFTKFFQRFHKFIEAVCVMFFAIMVVLLAVVVFCRYVLNFTPIWADETAQFCMVWFGLLSAALAIGTGTHIRITVWDNWMPPRIKITVHMIIHFILLGIIALMFVYGARLAQFTVGHKLSDMGVSYAFLYASIPFSAVCMFVATVGRMKDILAGK